MADDEDTPTLPAIISRAEARAAGLARYFTGSPCKRGHMAYRTVVNANCTACNAGLPERRSARAAWAASNRGKQLQYIANWNAANREKTREYARAWKKANPDRARAANRNYDARKRSAGKAADGGHTARDIREIYALQRGKCAYCRQKVGRKFHVDHITPLSKGGTNVRANIQICCPECNLKKHTRDPIEHAQSLGLLL